jgi:DNA-binding NtrC family response regulator
MATLLSMYDHGEDFIKREPVTEPTQRPQSISELDVRRSILEEIALKTLYLSGTLSVLELANRMHLSYEVVDALFSQLRAEQFCLVTGMTGHVHQIAITSQGRTRAVELLADCHYAGAAPVSFERYAEQTRKQSVKKVDVHAADVHRAFANLVIDNETLRKFGTALNSGSSVFLWGPAGVGKTTMAETLSCLPTIRYGFRTP